MRSCMPWGTDLQAGRRRWPRSRWQPPAFPGAERSRPDFFSSVLNPSVFPPSLLRSLPLDRRCDGWRGRSLLLVFLLLFLDLLQHLFRRGYGRGRQGLWRNLRDLRLVVRRHFSRRLLFGGGLFRFFLARLWFGRCGIAAHRRGHAAAGAQQHALYAVRVAGMAEDDIVEARALQQGRQPFIRRGRTEFRGYALDAGIHAFELNSRLIADAAQNVAQPGIGALDREQSVLKAEFRGRGRLLFRRQRRRWRRQQGAYKSATLRGHDTIRRRSDRPSGDPCGDGRRCNDRNPWVGGSDPPCLASFGTRPV